MAIGSFKLPNAVAASTDPNAWIRPTDWLSMPTIGTQEFIGLLAITNDESNHIALLCTGAYTVDWGDGVTENVATGVKAQHTYTYSAISSGTLSTRGYKQVLVRVTPQAGQNLTKVDLQQQNSILAKNHSVGWLDLSINGANITSIILGVTMSVRISMCERVIIGLTGTITNYSSFFSDMIQLQSVSISTSSSVTDFSYMFYNCYSLKTISLINTGSGTNFWSMFYNCYSLQTIPLINTSSATSFQQMFFNCYSLQTIPLINTYLVTNFSYMFVNCYSLKTIPLINTGSGTNFTQMFNACNSLQTIPLINTGSGINFTQMFYNCVSLQSLPNLNTALGTGFSNIVGFGVSSIAKAAFQGTRYAISYSGNCLSQSAIVDIFNGLGTAVGAQTITVSSNPGYAGLTVGERLIATAKGFTIA